MSGYFKKSFLIFVAFCTFSSTYSQYDCELFAGVTLWASGFTAVASAGVLNAVSKDTDWYNIISTANYAALGLSLLGAIGICFYKNYQQWRQKYSNPYLIIDKMFAKNANVAEVPVRIKYKSPIYPAGGEYSSYSWWITDLG